MHGFAATVSDLVRHSGYLDTDVNKSDANPAEEQLDKPDGPLPGSVSDQKKKASTFSYLY